MFLYADKGRRSPFIHSLVHSSSNHMLAPTVCQALPNCIQPETYRSQSSMVTGPCLTSPQLSSATFLPAPHHFHPSPTAAQANVQWPLSSRFLGGFLAAFPGWLPPLPE